MNMTNCVLCDETLEWADNDVLECQWCSNAVHKSCLGITGSVKCGKILWSCNSCMTKSVTNFDTRIAEIEERFKRLESLPERVNKIESDYYGSTVNPETAPYKFALMNSSTNAVKQDSNRDPLFPGAQRQRRNSKRRDRSPSENVPDSEPKKQRTVKPVMVGSKQGNSKIAGIVKPPKRRHLFVSRFSKETTIDDVIDWCDSGGAKPILSREVTKSEARMRSFHLVFAENDSDKIDDPDFWPINVNVARYYLNQEARDWLKEQLDRPAANIS